MNEIKTASIISFFAMIPYALVAWGYTRFDDGNSGTFWSALGILMAVRLFFSFIETLGTVVVWRVYGKRVMAKKFLHLLQSYKFPPRFYKHDSFLSYLFRIYDDNTFPEGIRNAARETERFLAMYEDIGILFGARMHSAWEAALEIYSPKAQAKVWGNDV